VAGPMCSYLRDGAKLLGFRADELSHDDLDGLLIATAPRELNDTVGECEERVILPHANVCTGIVLRASLAQYDVACDDAFTAVLFYTQALTLGIASVARGAQPLFMRETL
jgi:hypothetical protein